MQYTGPTSISKFKKVINENDLIAGDGLLASGRTWSTKPGAQGLPTALVAKVSNTGPLGTESDYTDYRYWVIVQQNNISSGALTVGATLNLNDRYINSNKSIMSVVNPGEYQAGSHSLSVGTIVQLVPIYIDQSDGNAMPLIRWVIVSGPTEGDIHVLLTKDGGSDGNAAAGLEATWTYSAYDINTGQQYAVQLPLYGHRPLAQQTIDASIGTLIKVTDPTNIGYGGRQDIAVNGGDGYGYSGSGSAAGSGTTDQPYRLWSCDEQFPMNPVCENPGSGSA